MDFIKRHYEKVILLGLFVLFVGLMFLVQSVISSTGEVSDAQLKLPKRVPDFSETTPTGEKFDTVKIREATQLVWRGQEFKGADYVKSDFVSVFPMAACPHCREARGADSEYTMLVPQKSFTTKDDKKNRVCPQCGKELLMAPEISLEELEEHSENDPDRDNDGVLDEDESKYGMSSDDPNDARYDMDGDGFSNRFEIENGFAPNSIESHPPYWWRLQIKDIKEIELPVTFKAIDERRQPNNKKVWSLQFDVPDRYGRKGRFSSEFFSIGDTITIEGRKYRIDDVERRFVPKSDAVAKANTGAERGMDDVSRVFLIEVVNPGVKPDKLTMTMNKPAYSSDKRPVLVDSGDISEKKSEKVLKIGDTIRLERFQTQQDEQTAGGNRKRRGKSYVATYRLKSVDTEKNSIIMEEVRRKGQKAKSEADDDVIEIFKAEPKVPSDRTPIKKVEQSARIDGEENPDMPMPKAKSRPRRR